MFQNNLLMYLTLSTAAAAAEKDEQQVGYRATVKSRVQLKNESDFCSSWDKRPEHSLYSWFILLVVPLSGLRVDLEGE